MTNDPGTGVWCCEFELAGNQPPTGVVAAAGEWVMRVLVRLHGEPLGYVTVARHRYPAAEADAIVAAAWHQHADAITSHLRAESLALPSGNIAVPVAGLSAGIAGSGAQRDSAALPSAGSPGVGIAVPAAGVSLSWRAPAAESSSNLLLTGDDSAPTGVGSGWRAPTATASCPNAVYSTDRVSVVVCTRDRAASLGACLDRLARVRYPHVEFLIVDNAPSDDSTRRLVAAYASNDPRFRYVHEPRAGLSRARNKGLAEAGGRFLAYTDDDVAVDAGWVDGVIRGFQRRPDVTCVTGLVATAAISNSQQAYFDARTSSWSTRCQPQLFDLADSTAHGVLYPFSAGIFGTGASFAFDRATLISMGGFDEALGAGTLTRGGEDLDIFVRVLLAGGAISYEPAALVWHHHRVDLRSLRKQMFGYGTGLTAYLTKLLMQPSTRGQVLRRVPAGLAKMAGIKHTTNHRLADSACAPAGALRREFAGFLAGPILYARARRALRATPRPEQAR